MIYMIPLVMVFCFLLEISGYASRENNNLHMSSEAGSVGDNMRAYEGFIQQYATANPAFSGIINDSAIPIPNWFTKAYAVNNYVTAGHAYVYNTSPPIGLVGYISKQAYYNINVGIANNGILTNPTTSGTPPIALPAAIPSGSVVIAPY